MTDKNKSLVPVQRDAVSIVGKQLRITEKVLAEALLPPPEKITEVNVERRDFAELLEESQEKD